MPESWFFFKFICIPEKKSHSNWIMTINANTLVPRVAKILAPTILPVQSRSQLDYARKNFNNLGYFIIQERENAHIFVLYKMKSTRISWNHITIMDSYLLLKMSEWIYFPFAYRIICIYLENVTPVSNALKKTQGDKILFVVIKPRKQYFWYSINSLFWCWMAK